MINVSSSTVITNSHYKLLTVTLHIYQYLQHDFHMQNVLSNDLTTTMNIK